VNILNTPTKQNQRIKMTKSRIPEILDRVYLKNPRPSDNFNLAIEFITHHEGKEDEDCVRLIDLNTGEVFVQSQYFSDAQEIIGYASSLYPKHDRHFMFGWKKDDFGKKELRTFQDIPIEDQLRHITEMAHNLATDMRTDMGSHIVNPVLEATQLMQQYNFPCFYLDEDGDWQIDMDVNMSYLKGQTK
jgi:hypothetical protein